MSGIKKYQHRKKIKHMWVIKNREKNHIKYMENRESRSAYDKIIILQHKIIVYQYYTDGFMKCAKCGFDSNIDALTVDHINNNGNEHRKNENFTSPKDLYRWLIKNNFPDGFQILCFNCNCVKHIETGNYNNKRW